MRNKFVFYKARGASKPNRFVYLMGSYGTDSTCKAIAMEYEWHYSLSHTSGTNYDAVVKDIYLTLDEDGLNTFHCKSMKAGKKYRIQ